MKYLVTGYYFAYLAINLLIGGVVSSLINPGVQFPSSVFTTNGLIIAGLITLAELFLPKRIRSFQMVLSSLLILTNMSGSPASSTISNIVFGLVAVIKLYALYCVVMKVRGMFGKDKKKAESVNPANGKSFYSSRAWQDLRYKILNEHGRHCVSCGKHGVTDSNGNPIEYHVDHIKPRSKYPHLALDPNNMQVLCKDCNLGKSNKWEINHRRERGIA